MRNHFFSLYHLNLILLYILFLVNLYNHAFANDNITFYITNYFEKSFLIKGSTNNINNIITMSFKPNMAMQKTISKPLPPTNYTEIEGYIFVIKPPTSKRFEVRGKLPKYLFNQYIFTSKKNRRLNGWIIHICLTEEVHVFPIIWGVKSLGKKQIYNASNIPNIFSALTCSYNIDIFEKEINYIEVTESTAGAFFYIKNTLSCTCYQYSNDLKVLNE